MLPIRLRLAPHQNRQVTKGKRVRTLFFEIRFIPALSSRWLILIPKNTVRLAAVRNRQKRLISQTLTELSPRLKTEVWASVKLLRPLPLDTLAHTKQLMTDALKQFIQHEKTCY